MSFHPEFTDSTRTRQPWGFAKFFSVWFFGAIAAIFASFWIASVASNAASDGNFAPMAVMLLLGGAVIYNGIFRADPADEDLAENPLSI